MGQLVSKSGKGGQLWRGERIERIFVVFVPVSLYFFTLFVTRRLPRRRGRRGMREVAAWRRPGPSASPRAGVPGPGRGAIPCVTRLVKNICTIVVSVVLINKV